LVDNWSGVGLHVVAVDVTGDGVPDKRAVIDPGDTSSGVASDRTSVEAYGGTGHGHVQRADLPV